MNAKSSVAGLLANLAGVVALAAVVSYWGWRWFAPVPSPLQRAPVDDVVTALAVSPPFGTSAPADLATGSKPPAAGTDPRVLGVLAERDGKGRALLRLSDGTARFAAAGETLAAGTTLVAVQPDGVTIRDGAGERRLLLREPPASAPTPSRVQAPRTASCVPSGYRGPVVRLNAELVAGLIAQPQALAAVVAPQDGALVVREEGGFAALLGLRKGDRVAQANGIALRSAADIVIAVLRPLAANQPVRVSGQRGPESQELLIVNAGACPS